MADVWINSRYEGKCAECDCTISEGDRILWCPDDYGRTYCSICGEEMTEIEPDIEVE